MWKFVDSGGLEEARQQALYVELQDKDIKTPASITREKAFAILNRCHEAFAGSGDLAFSGFTANSTKKSESLAKYRIQALLTSFDECKAHNTLFDVVQFNPESKLDLRFLIRNMRKHLSALVGLLALFGFTGHRIVIQIVAIQK